MKYGHDEAGRKYSNAPLYHVFNSEGVKEMHRQVGELEIDEDNVARRGLLVRHLVLPGGLAGTAEVMKFIAEEISKETHVNVMNQYRPVFLASRYPELNRPVSSKEFFNAFAEARRAGIRLV